jgi:Tat protein secretion system quality control protein TatD with DNase activity
VVYKIRGIPGLTEQLLASQGIAFSTQVVIGRNLCRDILKVFSDLRENTSHLRYKQQPVNAYGHIHCWQNTAKEAVSIVSTSLYRGLLAGSVTRPEQEVRPLNACCC